MPLRVSWPALSVAGKRKVAVYGCGAVTQPGLACAIGAATCEFGFPPPGIPCGIELLHMHCF